jgi:putative restriction endonuclease
VDDIDLAVRLAAFDWLREKTNALGDVLPRSLLQKGFEFQGMRIPLVSPQGIFKPRLMSLPLSITTTPKGPYRDVFTPNGLLTYSYRGTNPRHPDNQGLRDAIRFQKPLVYLHGFMPGKYLAVWPVYIIGDNEKSLAFQVAVDDPDYIQRNIQRGIGADDRTAARRAYITSTVRVRLHQQSFRERVLAAYRSQCSLCRLKHEELLDAAHILPDSAPEGEPLVTNGIALCKLHHAAFDSFIIGVDPDYMVHIRKDVLDEHDGPTLRHSLQGLHGARLLLPASPANWPDRAALDWRYQKFTGAQ